MPTSCHVNVAPFMSPARSSFLGQRGGVVRFFSKIPIRSTSVCVCVCTCCRLIGWLLCVKMRWPSLGGFSPAPDPTATCCCCCFVGGKLTNVHRRGFGQKSCARPLTFPKFPRRKARVMFNNRKSSFIQTQGRTIARKEVRAILEQFLFFCSQKIN